MPASCPLLLIFKLLVCAWVMGFIELICLSWRQSELRAHCWRLTVLGCLFAGCYHSAAGSYEDNKELYYHAEDFVIGKSVSILGRDVLLRACDPFTRSYYEEVHGFTQPEPLVPDTTPPPAAEVCTHLPLAWCLL